MMKAHLTRRYWFAASHRLYSEHLSPDQNSETYGKCSNPYGHGHNYALEVTVSGDVNPATGMICNLPDLDNTVKQNILERFDHQNLNCLPEFRERVPTTENLCIVVHNILKQTFQAAHLERVRLEETSQNSFEIGEQPPL